MSRRPDHGWGAIPYPREPRGPFWSLLRQRSALTVLGWVASGPTAAWWGTGSVSDAGIVAVGMVTMLASADIRAVVGGQVRRLVAERRLRTAFRESGPFTVTGLVPTVVRSVARSEHRTVLWVWCPAGISVAELAAAHEVLAEACFVDAIVVEHHQRWQNVAVLHLVRHGLGRRDGGGAAT